jgi:hypothetical protein
MLQRALRAVAVAVAVAGLVDPAITRPRSALREVAVVAVDPADTLLRARVVSALPAPVTVTSAPRATSDATIVLGARRIGEVPVAGRLIVLTPPAREAALYFEAVSVPPQVSLESAAAVRVRLHARNVTGRRVSLALLDGALTVAAVELVLPAPSAVIDTVLTALPQAAGPWALRVSARGGEAVAHWDALTQVQAAPWRVLVFDARAAWLSTFVRRALEADPRFSVTHRVVTAPGVSRAAGPAPASLTDVAQLAQADVVVIGAPDALDAAATRTLERYARSGGAVVLLVDSLGGAALRSLSGVATWRETQGVRTATDARGARLTSARRLAPDPSLPAVVEGSVYRAALGRGSVLVSAALDAWQFRDAARSDFALLWPQLIDDAALGTVRGLAAELDQAVLRPGDSLWLSVVATDGDALSLAMGDARRVLPTGPAYRRIGWTAPAAPGSYTLRVGRGTDTVALPLVVHEDARHDALPDEALLAAWANATGGSALPADSLTVLAARLDALMAPAGETSWHPMREPWWILVFALALGAEWYLRRRSGLA